MVSTGEIKAYTEFFEPTLWVEEWSFDIQGNMEEHVPARLISGSQYVGTVQYLEATGSGTVNGATGRYFTVEHEGNLTHVMVDTHGSVWKILSLGNAPK